MAQASFPQEPIKIMRGGIEVTLAPDHPAYKKNAKEIDTAVELAFAKVRTKIQDKCVAAIRKVVTEEDLDNLTGRTLVIRFHPTWGGVKEIVPTDRVKILTKTRRTKAEMETEDAEDKTTT